MTAAADRPADGSANAAGEAPLVLAEPLRQRLVQVAAEVLGRMPAEEVPPALRPIARFTPAKRVRLGTTALSAALDTDDDFRARVAEAITDATPALVEAVQNKVATPASDPVDTAVVAYLTRTDGWSEVVAAVNDRLASDQATRDAAADEIGRLRGELAELRTRLKAQTAALADAVAAASATSAEETTRLRNTLRARTGELRAAEEAAGQAGRELQQARGELEGARAGYEAELAAMRARIAELERAAETERRAHRTERDTADARLRLLIDTLADATAGLRRELALPASTLRPADTVAIAESGSAPAGPVALEELLALPQVHLIVDGYNVTKTGYPELPLADQRTRLVRSLATLHARTGAEITVVFDGAARPPAQPRTPRGVRVLFSAAGDIADEVIRRLVAAEPDGRPLVVVTSDNAVVTDVARAGAWTVPSAVLLDRLG